MLLTMVGAILIEICTSAPYRPGHWLLSDVTPEPQTLPPPLSTLPSPYYGPRPLKSTGRHGYFLNSTCDIELINMRQGYFLNSTCDRDFLNSTCDMGIDKRQRHATLAFLKIDTRHGYLQSGPLLLVPVWQQAPLSLATHSQSCIFHPSLVHFTPWPICGGGTNWYLAVERHCPVCD